MTEIPCVSLNANCLLPSASRVSCKKNKFFLKKQQQKPRMWGQLGPLSELQITHSLSESAQCEL